MPPRASVRNSASVVDDGEDITSAVTAVLDARVIEALVKTLTPILTATVEKCLNDKLSEFLKEHALLQNKVTVVENELASAKDEIRSLRTKIEALDAYTHRDNIIIHGLKIQSYSDAASVRPQQSTTGPERNDDVIEKAVVELFNNMNVAVSPADISAAHRLSSPRMTSGQSGGQQGPQASTIPPPIIVRFISRRARDAVFASRKNLKQIMPNVYINEHLTNENSALFRQGRLLCKAKKIHSCWTFNGSVYAKATEGGQSKRIGCLQDLPQ